MSASRVVAILSRTSHSYKVLWSELSDKPDVTWASVQSMVKWAEFAPMVHSFESEWAQRNEQDEQYESRKE